MGIGGFCPQGVVEKVPQIGKLWLDLDKNARREAVWDDPLYVERSLRPPPDFLPEFYWVDSLSDPEVIEAYISEAYYFQPGARLKIITPIRLQYVDPSAEAEREAESQAMAQPSVDFRKGRGGAGSAGWWKTVTLLPVDEVASRKVPDIAAKIDAGSDGPYVVFDRKTESKLFDAVAPMYEAHWLDARSGAYGIPQPKKYPQPKWQEGVIARHGLGEYGDGRISLKCEMTRRTCSAVQDMQGYYIFYDHFPAPRRLTLIFNSYSIEMNDIGAFFDRQSKRIYIIADEDL